MYSLSPLFRLQSAFVKKHYDAWRILSAKYGLVAPDEIIEPYDERSTANDFWPTLFALSLDKLSGYNIDTFIPASYAERIHLADVRFLRINNPTRSKVKELVEWKRLSELPREITIEELIQQKVLMPQVIRDILFIKEGRNEPFESS